MDTNKTENMPEAICTDETETLIGICQPILSIAENDQFFHLLMHD